MENLIVQIIMILMYSLVTSVIAQALSEGIIKTMVISNKAAIKVTVLAIEVWLVYYVVFYTLNITEWQTLVMITLFVVAGAEVINSIIKSLKELKNGDKEV